VTLIQLKYLLGVVDNGLSMTAAAERLHTSQPGISRQLRVLEEELGVQIFSRKGKSLVEITPAGQKIVGYARQILRDVESIGSISKDLSTEQEGNLSVVTTNTHARYVLPDVIRQFRELYPKIDLELQQGTTEQISEMAADGQADFVICSDSEALFPELNRLPCYRWDGIVLTRKDHPFALANRALSIADLAEHSLITDLSSSSPESSFFRAFEENQLEPNIAFAANDTDVIKTYVRLGMGVGVLAPMAVEESDLVEFYAASAQGLFPTLTTWIGKPKDRAMRGYMYDFVELFAPHLNREVVDQCLKQQNKAEMEESFSRFEIPTY